MSLINQLADACVHSVHTTQHGLCFEMCGKSYLNQA